MPAGQVIGYFAEIAASSDKARDTSQVGVISGAQRVGVFNFGTDRVRVLEKIFRDGSGMDWVRVFASYI